jgi:diaminopimelate epimerase
MNIRFSKYQGTGNDFIMVDNRAGFFPKENTQLIQQLCDRRFGIGADGFILLENDSKAHFKMVYYNSDGNQSTMCGNGGRCIVAFAKQLNIVETSTQFSAVDGLHYAQVDENGMVSLQMTDVDGISKQSDYVFLNTGSPHHVVFVDDVSIVNVKGEGAAIRYGELYGKEGSNVNFVQVLDENHYSVRTYERGVEDETYSCGTGVTAVAIAAHSLGKTNSTTIDLKVLGGELKVSFEERNGNYTRVFLTGPAKFVFEGTIQI